MHIKLLALFAALPTASALTAGVPALRAAGTARAGRATMVTSWYDSGTRLDKEDRLGAGGRGGHAVRGQPELSPEEKAVQTAVMEHQRSAARLSMAEDARSLVAYSTGYAVLSTLSSAVDGYPSGALVGFQVDDQGLPFFVFSSMSSHTKDLVAAERPSTTGGKAALTVTAKGFEGAADGRVTLIGDVKRCGAEEVEELGLKAKYKEKHPNAFWVDFGDFTFFRMHELKAVNFVGGFARAANPKAEEYLGASVDPIQAFAAPVMGHMNDDHSESTIAMVQHYIGLPQVEKADLVQLDRLGFMVQVTRTGQTFKLRLPFPRAAEDRKDVKTLIVEMTQTSLANPEVQSYLQELTAAKETEAQAA